MSKHSLTSASSIAEATRIAVVGIIVVLLAGALYRGGSLIANGGLLTVFGALLTVIGAVPLRSTKETATAIRSYVQYWSFWISVFGWLIVLAGSVLLLTTLASSTLERILALLLVGFVFYRNIMHFTPAQTIRQGLTTLVLAAIPLIFFSLFLLDKDVSGAVGMIIVIGVVVSSSGNIRVAWTPKLWSMPHGWRRWLSLAGAVCAVAGTYLLYSSRQATRLEEVLAVIVLAGVFNMVLINPLPYLENAVTEYNR